MNRFLFNELRSRVATFVKKCCFAPGDIISIGSNKNDNTLPVYCKNDNIANILILKAEQLGQLEFIVYEKASSTVRFREGFQSSLNSDKTEQEHKPVVEIAKSKTINQNDLKFQQLRSYVSTRGLSLGKDFARWELDNSNNFAIMYSICDEETKLKIIEIFKKDELSDCLIIKNNNLTLRINLFLFENPLNFTMFPGIDFSINKTNESKIGEVKKYLLYFGLTKTKLKINQLCEIMSIQFLSLEDYTKALESFTNDGLLSCLFIKESLKILKVQLSMFENPHTVENTEHVEQSSTQT